MMITKKQVSITAVAISAVCTVFGGIGAGIMAAVGFFILLTA
jgi:hypothetical protein